MKIDTTQPHIGRIYDYVLGGHHNYEADRKAAEELTRAIPTYPKWARLNRWFLQFVANQWAADGHGQVLDLASGLPTQGHFHDYLPDARILFSDIDAVSVVYGGEALAGKPNTKYVEADLRKPERLLAEAATFFGNERKIAVGAIGILYFLSDEEVSRLMRALHAFCGPGSVLGFSFFHVPVSPGADNIHDALQGFPKLARINVHPRTPEQMTELIKPWKMRIHRNAEEWLEVREMLTESDRVANVVGALADY